MCGGGSQKRAANAEREEANRQRQEAEAQRAAQEQKERERQARVTGNIATVNSSFDAFDDGFFKERGNEVSNFFNPQVDEQFADANKSVQFALANRGLLDSSTQADKSGELVERRDDKKRNIAEQALAREASTRSEVETQRGNLLGQAEAGAGLESINSQLKGVQTNVQAPGTFDPLGQIFGDLAFSLAGGALSAKEAGKFNKPVGPSAGGVSSAKTKVFKGQ